MAFMVVNSGRAASRAFYLNLKKQHGLAIVPRYRFDQALREHLSGKNSNSFQRLFQEVNAFQKSRNLPLGIVFHGVRPILNYPFDSPQNIDLLKTVRDQFKITQVFFPIRDPKGLFLSELNRRLAFIAGDWAFPEGLNGWHSDIPIKQILKPNHEASQSNSVTFPTDIAKPTARELATDISQRTGKILSLYNLFKSVFEKVWVFHYQDFIDEPARIYNRMGQLAGFQFDDRSLLSTKLNSLTNRFLIYNPVSCRLGTLRFPSIRRGNLTYRFELSDVMELCDDWGTYEKIHFDCAPWFGDISKAMGGNISLGVKKDELTRLSGKRAAHYSDPDFAERLMTRIGPIFERNFNTGELFYRDELYFKNLPEDAFQIFWASCHDEYEELWRLIEDGAVRQL